MERDWDLLLADEGEFLEGPRVPIRLRPVALVPDRRVEEMPKGLVDQAARPTHRVAPVYPAELRKRQVEGKVILAVEVKASGAVGRIVVREGSGSQGLDNAAMKALRKWKFAPASRDGRKVASTVLQPVNFALR